MKTCAIRSNIEARRLKPPKGLHLWFKTGGWERQMSRFTQTEVPPHSGSSIDWMKPIHIRGGDFRSFTYLMSSRSKHTLSERDK